MGPARSHCATLLRGKVLLSFSYESQEDDAIREYTDTHLSWRKLQEGVSSW